MGTCCSEANNMEGGYTAVETRKEYQLAKGNHLEECSRREEEESAFGALINSYREDSMLPQPDDFVSKWQAKVAENFELDFRIQETLDLLKENRNLENWATMGDALGKLEDYFALSDTPYRKIKRDSDSYWGEVSSGEKFQGIGFFQKAGSFYYGSFNEGQFEGKGILIDKRGRVYLGYFYQGKCHGYGRLLDLSKCYDQGKFHKGNKNGLFIRYDISGKKVTHGKWSHGRSYGTL